MPDDTRLGIPGLEWLKERSLQAERVEKTKKLKPIANDLGVSLPKLALAWCLKNTNVSTVILGASRVSQLQENLGAFDVVPLLADDVMERLENVLENKPELPEY